MTIHFSSVPATFMHCRRSGSTSFKFWVRANIEGAEEVVDTTKAHSGLMHMTPEQISEKWSNPGTTFAFVRNPYARLVSVFHWVGQGAKRRLHDRATDPSPDNYVFPLDLDIKLLVHYNKGFDHWIKNRLDFPYGGNEYGTMALFHNPHIQTQMYCFSGIAPNLIIKLEDISTEFVKVQDLLNCHIPLIHRNTSEHVDYRSYYTTEARQLAEKWLEADLDTFKYTF